MIVLDASAAVDLLVERGEPGEWVVATLAGENVVGAPHLVDQEVLSTLRQLLARREIREALADFADLGIVRYPVADLLEGIWRLRDRLTPYDASYVVLAEALDAPLVTTDARLGRAAGHRARVVAYPA
ncbi:MAG: type II toxin-antitoxin system VapC family toxin [Gaiellaceae bacterium]